MNHLKIRSFVDQDEHEKTIVTEILVDDQPLTNFAEQGLSTDLPALQQSINQDGEFYIVTCWCGHPGCAGIREGIKVAYEEPNIHWVVRGIGPTRTFYFDKQEYETAIKQGIRQLQYVMKDKSLGVAPEINKSYFGSPPADTDGSFQSKKQQQRKRKRKKL